MSVEANIFSALTSLVSARVYPDYAPANTVRPFITFKQVGGEVFGYLDNAVPNIQNGHYEISVWADTRAAAADLSRQCATALCGSTAFQCGELEAPQSDFFPDVPMYGTNQVFSIWSTR